MSEKSSRKEIQSINLNIPQIYTLQCKDQDLYLSGSQAMYINITITGHVGPVLKAKQGLGEEIKAVDLNKGLQGPLLMLFARVPKGE